MLFSDLKKITFGKILLNEDLPVRRFSTDSRMLSGALDEVFIASKGQRDGHDYIMDASNHGIKNFIVEKIPEFVHCNFIKVRNSIDAFQQIATYHRKQFNLPMVGITGSNGKTTVKEWLSTILSEKYFVVKNPKSYNSQVGVPTSILEIREIHEVGVFEAGISTVREMVKLEKIILPTNGIFTTLGNAHSEGFENDEQKLLEKLKLFKHAKKVVCRNDAAYSGLLTYHLGSKSITWAIHGVADYQVKWENGSILVNNLLFQSNLYNVVDLENATHAIVMALQLKVNHDQIQKGLSLIKPVPMRLEFKKAMNESFVLDDSYNNDLQGLKVALSYMDSHKQKERKTLILSDILQSGKNDQSLYGEVADLLKEKRINRLIGVGSHISVFKEKFSSESLFFNSTVELLENFPDFKNEMIIVKGARDFELERVVKKLEKRIHDTVLEVNFEALQYNLSQYRTLLHPSTKLMVMVKANAYGSGILEIANFLQHQRVDQLGVAYVDEAIQLRENGIHLPIMIMNPQVEGFRDFKKHDLEAEIFGLNHLDQLLSSIKNPPKIHIKVDTGMHRLGFVEEEIPTLIGILKKNSQLKLTGVFTHFSSAENHLNDEFTLGQAQKFESIYKQIAAAVGYQPIKHACNSSGIVRWPQYHFNMVRLGIGLHGFDPTGQLNLRATSQLKTIISQVRLLKKGATVGYSRKGVIERDSKIAIIPIGYEDGFQRIFGNRRGSVLVGNKRCPTIGNICMDMTMIDVTKVDAKEGDEVIVFGDNPKIHDLADWASTIPYEILTNVSNRVKRVFVWE
ncbi:MAG: bifunctional UDP-N-acetylmuramoyl-tripeptide:D-alanyl-D-alanine ligase/alanine racemase [Bacteroidota bacterium]